MKKSIKKKTMCIIAMGSMFVGLMNVPVNLYAADHPIQDSSGAFFDTLAEAAENGNGYLILQDNITQPQMTVAVDKHIQLDLNGKTLTLQKENGPGLVVNGYLEITGNGDMTKTGYGYLIENNGTTNIINGTFTDDTLNEKEQNGTKNSALIKNVGKMTISNGTFTDSGIVIKNDDASADLYGELTINGGTFTCTTYDRFAAIQNSGYAEINNGNFNGGNATFLTRFWEGPATTVITGGTFNQPQKDRYTFANYFDTASKTATNRISGGTFNGAFGADIILDSSADGYVDTTISGGQFQSDVSSFLKEGYSCIQVGAFYEVAQSATAITLSETMRSLNVGSAFTLKATLIPESTLDNVIWSTSDANVATVNADGIVEAKANGTATITAKVGNLSAVCQISVTSIEIEQPDTNLKPNENIQMTMNDSASQETLKDNVTNVIQAIIANSPVPHQKVDANTMENLKQAIQSGKAITAKTVMTRLNEKDLSQNETDKITEIKTLATSSNQTLNVVQYFDLSIQFFTDTNEVLGTMNQLDKEITYTIVLPKGFDPQDQSLGILRIHNDEAEFLNMTWNEDGTLSFKTDHFSTYAFVTIEDQLPVVDQQPEKPAEPLTPEHTETTTVKTVEQVDTGDENMVSLIASFAGAALISGLILVLDKKRKELLNK